MPEKNRHPTRPGRYDPDYISFSIETQPSENLKIDKENREIDLSISSEIKVKRWWGEMVLGHNPGECRLERIKTVGSFLFAHGRDPQQGVMPVGPVLDVYLDEKARKYRARLKFDTDERSELIFQKVQSGSLKGVSVGVQIYKFLHVEEGEEERGFSGPVDIATDWEIYEISLEPTPAIPNVGVGLSLSDSAETPSENNQTQEVNDMKMFTVTRDGKEVQVQESELTSEERIQLGLYKPPAQQQDPPKKEGLSAEEAAKAERERQKQIREICFKAGIEGEELSKYLDGDYTVEQVQKFALEKLASERTPVSVSYGGMVDETDKFRAAAIDGLSAKAGVKIEKPAPGANDFRRYTLLQLMQHCYYRQNGKPFFGSPEELFYQITKQGEKHFFDGDTERFSGPYASSSDFPLILANVANKSMLQAYQEAPTTYQTWVAVGNLRDFKPATGVRMSEAPGLEDIGEHGEFRHGQMTESAVRRQLSTKGIKWSLTRVMIINDDLDAFTKMPAAYAAAARRNINTDVYRTLNGNPVMDEDNIQLFDAAHNNLSANPAVVSVQSLDEGLQAMMTQRGLLGEATLNIKPRYILLPPSRATAAMQVIASTIDPGQLIPGIPNPFHNSLVAVVDAELQNQTIGGSLTAWRLLADQNQAPTIQVDFLNGRDTPIMESQVSFNMLGIEYRMYHDWGVKAIDWRGAYMNPGA